MCQRFATSKPTVYLSVGSDGGLPRGSVAALRHKQAYLVPVCRVSLELSGDARRLALHQAQVLCTIRIITILTAVLFSLYRHGHGHIWHYGFGRKLQSLLEESLKQLGGCGAALRLGRASPLQLRTAGEPVWQKRATDLAALPCLRTLQLKGLCSAVC